MNKKEIVEKLIKDLGMEKHLQVMDVEDLLTGSGGIIEDIIESCKTPKKYKEYEYSRVILIYGDLVMISIDMPFANIQKAPVILSIPSIHRTTLATEYENILNPEFISQYITNSIEEINNTFITIKEYNEKRLKGKS